MHGNYWLLFAIVVRNLYVRNEKRYEWWLSIWFQFKWMWLFLLCCFSNLILPSLQCKYSSAQIYFRCSLPNLHLIVNFIKCQIPTPTTRVPRELRTAQIHSQNLQIILWNTGLGFVKVLVTQSIVTVSI